LSPIVLSLAPSCTSNSLVSKSASPVSKLVLFGDRVPSLVADNSSKAFIKPVPCCYRIGVFRCQDLLIFWR